MKKLLIWIIALFLLVGIAAAAKVPPMITLSASNTTAVGSVTLSSVAMDTQDNAGIKYVDIYENNNLLKAKSCNSKTCINVYTATHTKAGIYTYYAKTEDLDGNIVYSSNVSVTFLNAPIAPVLNIIDMVINEDSGVTVFDLWDYTQDNDTAKSNLVYSFNQTSGSTVNCTLNTHYLSCNTTIPNGYGTNSIIVFVNDSVYYVNDTFNVVVQEVNDLPQFWDISMNMTEDSGNISLLDLDNYSFDVDGDNLTYSFTNGTSITNTLVQCNITGNNLSCISLPNATGVSIIPITANDGRNGLNTTNLTINITNVQDAPVLDALTNFTINEDTNFVYTVSAKDADPNATLVYSDNTSLFNINTSTGLINFTPIHNQTINQVGNYSVNISVSDGIDNDWQIVNFYVKEVNDAPIINAIPTWIVPEDTTRVLNLSPYIYDEEGDNITNLGISWTNYEIYECGYNATTSLITCTSDHYYNGLTNITIQAYDGNNYSNNYDLLVNVTPTNDAPVIDTIGNLTAYEGQLFTASFSWKDLDFNDIIVFYDNTSFFDVLTPISMVITPVNLSGNREYKQLQGNSIMQFMPVHNATRNDIGNHTINITISDGTVNVSQVFNLEIREANDAPIINLTNWTIIEDQINTIDLANYTYDEEGDNLTDWSFSVPNSSILNCTMNNSILNCFANRNNSPEYVTVIVSDGTNYSKKMVTVNITPVNDAPVINDIANQTGDINGQFIYQANATDEEGDNFTFGDNSTLFNISANGLINFTPVTGQNGTYLINITATDVNNGTGWKLMRLTIGDSNDAPTWNNFTLNFTEDVSTIFNLDNYTNDPEDDALSYTVLSSKNLNHSINASNLTLVNKVNDYNGAGWLVVKATDGEFNATKNISINIIASNDAPRLKNNIPNIYILKNGSSTINLLDYFEDVDNSSMIFTNTTPANVTVTINGSNATLTPQINFTGNNSIIFTASDGTFGTFSNNVTIVIVTGYTEVVRSTINNVNVPDGNYTQYPGAFTPSTISLSKIFDSNVNDIYTYIHDSRVNKSTIYVSNLSQNSYLFNSTLTRSSLINSRVFDSNLSNVHLVNAYVNPSTLGNVTLIGGSRFRHSEGLHSVINATNVTYCTVRYSDLQNGSVLYNCTAIRSNFNNVDLNNSEGIRSNITDSSLYETYLSGSTAINSVLVGPYVYSNGQDKQRIFDSVIVNSNLTKNSHIQNLIVNNSNVSYSHIDNSSIISSYVNGTDMDNSNILNSKLDGNIFKVDNSNVTNSIILDKARLTNSNILNSNLDNLDDITNSTITSSNLTKADLVNVTIISSNLNLTYDLTNSVISYSNLKNMHGSTIAIPSTNGVLYNVTWDGLFIKPWMSVMDTVAYKNVNLNGTKVTNSTLVDVTDIGSTIIDSNITGSRLNNVTVTSSNFTNVNSTNSVIVNSDVEGITLTNANVTNNVIYSGTIAPTANGTYNATASGPANLTDIINYAPNAAFSASSTNIVQGNNVRFTDQSTDVNINTRLNDSLTYFWDFGDGTNSTQQNPTHRYNAIGTHTAVLTVTDKYNVQDNASVQITVRRKTTTSSSSSSGGGGGGGGGGGSGPRRPGVYKLNFLDRAPAIKYFQKLDSYTFMFKDEWHEAKILEHDLHFIDVEVRSDPIVKRIPLYGFGKFDIDSDDTYDLKISYLQTGSAMGQIEFELISEPVPTVPVTVPEIPEPVPGEVPEPVPEEIPEEIPEEVPEPIPEKIPEPVPESKPILTMDLLKEASWIGITITLLIIIIGLSVYFIIRKPMYEKPYTDYSKVSLKKVSNFVRRSKTIGIKNAWRMRRL